MTSNNFVWGQPNNVWAFLSVGRGITFKKWSGFAILFLSVYLLISGKTCHTPTLPCWLRRPTRDPILSQEQQLAQPGWGSVTEERPLYLHHVGHSSCTAAGGKGCTHDLRDQGSPTPPLNSTVWGEVLPSWKPSPILHTDCLREGGWGASGARPPESETASSLEVFGCWFWVLNSVHTPYTHTDLNNNHFIQQ